MARPRSDASIDLSKTHELSIGLIKRLICPPDLPKVLLRDNDVSGLKVRATSKGAKSFIYEARLDGKAISQTLGGFPLMSIDEAKSKARALAKLVKSDRVDPRVAEREQATAKAAAIEASKIAAITVEAAWSDYMEQRRPYWGALHYQDHINKTKAGGLPSSKRGDKRLTTPGPLAIFMPLALKDLDQQTIEAWAAKEGKVRPASARLAWRLLTVFLTWCAEQPQYAPLLPTKNPGKTKKAREALGKAGIKKDVLQKSQLKDWFIAIQRISNPTISASIQVLLLTGARLNEVLTMRWEDVNIQWKGLTIKDKIEGSRDIPLTPYMEHLITALPRRNGYVFASARGLDMSPKNIARRIRKADVKGQDAPVGPVLQTSAKGHISVPNTPHTRACRTVGLDGLTLHGLRRSFKSLTEWLEVPVGVVAQIQGHKPSATAEKHYTVRPLELLRVHHEKIERWLLEQAEIKFDPRIAPSKLSLVAG